MFEGGVLPRVPAGGAAGTLGASAEDASADSVVASEEVAGLLGSLAAGGELAGVVEGLLAHLLVTAQDPNDDEGDGGGECSDTDGAGSVDDEGLFAGDSGGDTALVAGAEGHRVVSVEEAGATGVLGLGVWGLGELVAACHRLAAWASWGQSLAAACLTACGEQRTSAQLRADAITAMTLSTLRTSQQTACYRPTQTPDDDTPASTHHDNNSGADDGSLSAGTGDGLGSTGGFGGVSEPGSVPASLACPRRSASPGRVLPDGVPLEGLLEALSSLVGSTSPWWTPSGTGHLPLPKNIHIDVQVTVPLTSLVGLAPPEDPTGSGDPGGGERLEGARNLKSSGASPGQNPTVTTDPLNGAASQDGRRSLPTTSSRSLPTADGRTLPGSSRRSLPEPDPAAPASQPAASCSAAATGVAQVHIGAHSTAVPALTAWALAAGGTWRRLITDPASGTVLDVGRTRYRPPAGLADLVRARDRACVFPTCHTPAEWCDIDHLTAWSQGGTTSLDNLVVLCEAHHRLKHTLGWALTRDQASGTLSWHTPDKTVYQHHPDSTITRHPHKTGPHQHHTPSTVIPKNLSQQINPDTLNRLNRALDRALDNQAHNHTTPSTTTNANANGTARLETRGPQPSHKPGAFETTPYPKAAHTLQLAPLIDQAPPF